MLGMFFKRLHFWLAEEKAAETVAFFRNVSNPFKLHIIFRREQVREQLPPAFLVASPGDFSQCGAVTQRAGAPSSCSLDFLDLPFWAK